VQFDNGHGESVDEFWSTHINNVFNLSLPKVVVGSNARANSSPSAAPS
jgi:hypothetical protein